MYDKPKYIIRQANFKMYDKPKYELISQIVQAILLLDTFKPILNHVQAKLQFGFSFL